MLKWKLPPGHSGHKESMTDRNKELHIPCKIRSNLHRVEMIDQDPLVRVNYTLMTGICLECADTDLYRKNEAGSKAHVKVTAIFHDQLPDCMSN